MPEAVTPSAVQPAATPPAAAPAAPVVRAKGRFEMPADTAPAAKPETPEAPAAAESVATDAQNTEDQAPSTAPEVKPDEVTPEQAAKREGRRFERKLDKAYRREAEARARAELLEKQLAEARTATAPAAKPAEGEPKLADYDYDPEKYAAAKADYAKKQAEREIVERQRTAAQQAEHQRLVGAWDAKVDRAESKYEDFAEVVGDLQPTSPFVAAIMEADNGEDIAYHLGKNPKEAERIAKLPPLSQIREIGKLEAKLASTPEKPKAPSKAPAPIAPLTGATPAASVAPSERDDMRDWMRKRNKQVHGRNP